MNKLRTYLSGKNLYSIILHLLVIVLAIEVVLLMRQNKALKEGRGSAVQETIKEGEMLELSGLTPVTDGGQPDTTLHRQLIFVFTTRCPFCKETLPLWKYFADSVAQKNSVAVLGISLDPMQETQAYLTEQQIRFPVFIPAEKEAFSNKNKLHSVPQTILRNSGGIVEKVWRGRLTVDQFNEVVQAISIIHNPTIHK
ncbi:MAG TPA: redoxin domain-containing protein [Nitrososphaera sp.]|nr:redoxin domain-containing protein [Nitrososphaera sp.]